MGNGKLKAFTLIELLVVIAIISLLVSILLPSLNRAKELAKRVVCANNMKNMGTAFVLYTGDWDGWMIDGYEGVHDADGNLISYDDNTLWFRERDKLPEYLDGQQGYFYGENSDAAKRGETVSPHDPGCYEGNVFDCPTNPNWTLTDPYGGIHTIGQMGNFAISLAFCSRWQNWEGGHRRMTGVRNPSNKLLVTESVWHTVVSASHYMEDRIPDGHSDGANYLWVDSHVDWQMLGDIEEDMFRYDQ